ncbi:carbohydrate ABC transporter substrate-binding protein (CUT1 family) [Archangium gephyra]|uniref:Carbohydrate ABC transporter substrate-binding protein (CUT1 family) n=1 Tax=Archangium gephyra TaxID=48 RepID=A0AAC8TJX3_9BACT|nr:ABC transporter substrate-binding protein [Archangium gephyra]AKJ08445.1 Maltose/maltodextrin ABC transporter, substrate binding periplasmic protein MalE [Archangium gephyra]REG20555.1 carbohydrate ABC transporter substrate-binding protein (CUT1 family) [Archangium gephyra]
MRRPLISVLVLGLVLWTLPGCRRKKEEATAAGGKTPLVFKYQPLGDPVAFRELLADFERKNPDVALTTEALPNSSDVAHQFFLTSLEGGADDFDVLVVDVVWVPEFARAGWIADISKAFPPEVLRRDFLSGPVEAVVVDGKTYAVPWYVDVGVLFYRKDLVPRAPRTYAELEQFAREAKAKEPLLQGYVWQGRQYEGLNCNVFEAIWGHGGQVLDARGRLALDTEQARAGLAYLRRLISSGISPPGVTSAAEEEARRVFQSGQAVFMRNWPYAWEEAQKPDSPIRGKVGITTLPTLSGEPGWGTLGGWQLAVNAHVSPKRKEAAERLIAHLTSPEANVMMALSYGRNPPRPSVYKDPRLVERVPFIASLLGMVENARPRPVTPYYNLLSDVLQSEFSAAIAGIRPPEQSLKQAQRQVDHLTGQFE